MTPTSPSFTLGTAQLGLAYGLGAASRGIDEATATEILNEAWAHGIRCLDTARVYGVAEERIGRWRSSRIGLKGLTIITKFPAESVDSGVIRNALDASCVSLGVTHVDIFLAHSATDLLSHNVLKCLNDLVGGGLIGAFGASIYDPEEGKALLGINGLRVLQIPVNLASLTARMTDLLQSAEGRGVVVHARSTFLQGLLIMPLGELPPRFNRAAPILRRLEGLANEIKVSRISLALAAVRSCPGIKSIVIGVDRADQLAPILRSTADHIEKSAVIEALDICRALPPDISDPRRWPK